MGNRLFVPINHKRYDNVEYLREKWTHMADEPKTDSDHTVADQEPTPASISPAPNDVADDPNAKKGVPGGTPPGTPPGAPPPSEGVGKVQPDPLPDGTVPTVLKPGDGHRKVAKGKSSLTSIYRKADVVTTLLTFVGATVAGGLILGGYAYFTHAKSQTPAATPKVTKLNASDLSKLQAFFSGNSAGSSSEILTISSSSLFNNRVAIGSDLKVVGGLEVDGTTNLGSLNATKTVTLGVTNVGGQLTVNGPLTVQNPALFNAGGSFKGNLATTGNGTFGGSLSAVSLAVTDLSVAGTININGHLNLGGSNPSVAPASSYVSSATVDGNDSGGTVTVNLKPVAGAQAAGGDLLATVTFHDAFPRVPTVVITPIGRGSALFEPYILKTATNFIIGASTIPLNNNATSYSFDYWVVQ